MDSCHGHLAIGTPTIRNLDDDTKAQLLLQAARHGRSMEEGSPSILHQAVIGSPPQPPLEGMVSRNHDHVDRLGGVDLELAARSDQPKAPDLREVGQ